MNLWKKVLFVVFIASLVVINACQKDRVVLSGDVKIEFSADTIRFDTVFTSLGSATKLLKVYNNNDGAVNISSIGLDQGDNSFFRVNVDGVPGNRINDVEILANDSLYVFAEVTVDPDMPLSDSPFVIQEWLKFNVNGNEQQVLLEAWGQNANYIPNRFAQGTTSIISCDLQEVVFDDPKPYVIYGYLLIDSCHVILPAGTRVHVHGGVTRRDGEIREEGLIGILAKGRLSANGTVENPVIIEGDRLEEEFANNLGQWNGITFNGSKENRFTNTIVRNAIDGIWLNSKSEIKLENTQVYNTSRFGILGIDSEIEAENCLIHTNGANSIALVDGGDYRFEYCTIGNFGNEAEALVLDNIVCLDADCEQSRLNKLTSRFINCIISGDDDDEISLSNGNKSNTAQFDYFFQNCIIKIDELTDAENYPNFFEQCSGCDNVDVRDEELFIDFEEADFHLDTMSVALMNARPIGDLQFDLEGTMRDATNPDIGCYEFQE